MFFQQICNRSNRNSCQATWKVLSRDLSDDTSVTSLRRQKRSCFGNGRQKRSCVQVKDPPPTPSQGKNVSVLPMYDPAISRNYTMKVALGSCVFWSEEQEKWTAKGCQVSNN